MIKTLFMLLYRFISWPIWLLWRAVQILFVLLFGRFDWQAPGWLAATGRGARTVGRHAQARPRVSAIVVLALAALCAGGWYGWYWYQNRPVPETVPYRVTPPGLTNYRQETITPEPLRIQFGTSVAPLPAVGQRISEGIVMQPALAGAWRWANGSVLVFEPEHDWPVGQHYDVTLEPDTLLAPGMLLDEKAFEFESAPFTVKIQRPRFYEDPRDNTAKQLLATLTFSHPVDQDSVRRRIAIELGAGLQYRQGGDPAPTIEFDEAGLSANLHSASVDVPLESSKMQLEVKAGVVAQAKGDPTAEPLQASVVVPGRYQLVFSNESIQFVPDDEGDPGPVLFMNSSRAMADEALSGHVRVWQLPERKPDEGPWQLDRVNEAVLAAAAPVPLVQVPGVAPINNNHAFKFQAEPGQTLFVQVDAGVESFGGYLAREARRVLLKMPAYPRVLRFMSDGALLNLNGEHKLGFSARGVPGVQVEISRMLPNQLHHLVDQSRRSFVRPQMDESYFDRLVERKRLDISLPDSDPAHTNFGHIDLSPYLTEGDGRKGVFILRLAASDDRTDRSLSVKGAGDVRFIVVTDLGLIAKRAGDGSHDVFVQSLSTGKPVPDVDVDIVGRNGLPIVSARTDAQGHAAFKKLGELRRENQPLMVVARQGDRDMSFLPFARQSHILDTSRFDVGGEREHGEANRLQAYLFTDRGLYRPGETANLGMIVRRADWSGGLQGLPLMLRVTDPRGQVVKQETVRLSAQGFETSEFVSSQQAAAGDYQASLSLVGEDSELTELGQVVFKVRDFEPDRLKVDLKLTPKPVVGWVSPQDVQARVQAEHLFGGAASDRRVTAEMRLAPAFAGFARYADYRFRAYQPLSEISTQTLPELKTDEHGAVTVDLGLDRFADSTYGLQLLVKVYESKGGRGVAAQDRVLVSSSPWLVGVRSADALNYVSRGSSRTLHWLAIGPDLEPVAVEGLRTELVERRYVSVLAKQSDGSYRYVSQAKDYPVKSESLTMPVGGVEQTLDTSVPGNFIVRLKNAAGEVLNEIQYNVAGAGNVTRSLERNAELQLQLDKPEYKPGDEIAVSIRAPYTGSGLITIERDHVYHAVWFHADTTSSVQHIRIPEDLEGNAYVNVQFVRGLDSDEVYMSPLSYGVVPFKLDLGERRIGLKVEAQETVEPGDVVRIQADSARPARAVLYAVDAGILSVARYQQPDPLGEFFRKRALEVDTSQILDLVLPEFNRLLADYRSAAGGDGEGALDAHLNPFQRKRKPPVVWWSNIVDLPAGTSTYEYTVPDYFNGKLRIFAVAVDDNGVGVAQTQTAVRGPVVITPNVPAMVAPGDVFEVSAGLYSNLDAPAEAVLSIETGAGLSLEGDAPAPVALTPGRESTAVFRLRANPVLGPADIRFVLHAGGREVRLNEEVSVRPDSPHRVALTLGSFTTDEHTLALTRELYPELRDVSLSLDASPLSWARGVGDALWQEQYASSVFLLAQAMPQIVLGSRAGITQQATDAYQRAEALIRQRQSGNGMLGRWASSVEPDFAATLLAYDLLQEARQRGFEVESGLLERLRNAAKRIAAQPSEGLAELRTRAQAVYLLTRDGITVAREAGDILERYKTFHKEAWKTDIGSAYLASTFTLMLRQDSELDEMFAQVPWRIDGEAAHGGYGLAHDAERLTLAMRHFPKLSSSHLSQEQLTALGQILSRNQYSPLSGALLVRALEAYSESAAGQMQLSATALSGEQVDDTQRQALSLDGVPPTAAVPMSAQKLLLGRQGDSLPAFYLLSESGFDKQAPQESLSAGLEVFHEYVDASGKPVSTLTVGQEFFVRTRVRVSDRGALESITVVDLLPGGVEPVYRSVPDPDEASDEQDEEDEVQWSPRRAPVGEPGMSDWLPDQVDVREDRVLLHGVVGRDVRTFVYRVRAVSVGEFGIAPAYAEGSVDRSLQARSQPGRLTIQAP